MLKQEDESHMQFGDHTYAICKLLDTDYMKLDAVAFEPVEYMDSREAPPALRQGAMANNNFQITIPGSRGQFITDIEVHVPVTVTSEHAAMATLFKLNILGQVNDRKWTAVRLRWVLLTET